MKKTIAILLSAVMLLALLSGCSGKTWKGRHEVEIKVKDFGTITLEINADAAPQTASNFLNLARKGFYNNRHLRAIDGFAIYGGDPNRNGTGTRRYHHRRIQLHGYNNPCPTCAAPSAWPEASTRTAPPASSISCRTRHLPGR